MSIMDIFAIVGLCIAAVGLISPPLLLLYQNHLVDKYEAVVREQEQGDE